MLPFLAIVIVSIFVTFTSVRWVWGPFAAAAKNRDCPVQFSLADFLCLFVEVQLSLGVPVLMSNKKDGAATLSTVCALIIAIVLLIWRAGVRTLPRAGVHGTIGRALALTLTIPFGFAASIAVPVIAVAISDSFEDWPSSRPATLCMTFVDLCLVVLIAALGFMTRYIVRASNRKQDPPPIEPASPS